MPFCCWGILYGLSQALLLLSFVRIGCGARLLVAIRFHENPISIIINLVIEIALVDQRRRPCSGHFQTAGFVG